MEEVKGRHKGFHKALFWTAGLFGLMVFLGGGFIGIIGLILMIVLSVQVWRNPPAFKGITLGTLTGIIWVVLIFACYIGSSFETKPVPKVAQVNNYNPPFAQPVLRRVVNQVAPPIVTKVIQVAPPIKKTLEDYVKESVIKHMGELHNMKKIPIYKGSEVADYAYQDAQGQDKIGKRVLAKYLLNENFSKGMMKDSLSIDGFDVFKDIYNNPECSEIQSLCLESHFWLQDVYGNDKEEAVSQLTMLRSTAQKINWPNFLWSNLPTLLENEGKYWVHPAFNK